MILKDSMLYKTRQLLVIPRHSRTLKEHTNPEYKVLTVEFAKIQFGLKIREGGGGLGPPGSSPGSTTVTFQEVKRNIMCVLMETRVSRS